MKATRPTTQIKTAIPSATAKRAEAGKLFGKENFKWMLIGVAVLILGFILMAGGHSDDPNVFNKDEVYSTRRITIAPIIILIGLVIEIYAIFRQPKTAEASV
ncbi:MAG: hypothetical protein JWR72_4134 [Flavisolibacter sp.]|jgi:hypothetical protein|nr:hypothetical protein [Flavisolibacter sp.]